MDQPQIYGIQSRHKKYFRLIGVVDRAIAFIFVSAVVAVFNTDFGQECKNVPASFYISNV